MSRRLTANFVVLNPNTYLTETFGPGDEVPDWAAAQITDESAWTTESAPARGGDEPAPPPTSGKGSGRPAWAEYAKANEVEVDDDMTRDDIVAAVEAAGVPIA